MWNIFYSKQALKDIKKIKNTPLYAKFKELIDIIKIDPYAVNSGFKKLNGFQNTYSRRLNIQHRLVYKIVKNKLLIEIISTWEHY